MIKKEGSLRLIHQLLVVAYYRESIFENKYLRKYEGKIKKHCMVWEAPGLFQNL